MSDLDFVKQALANLAGTMNDMTNALIRLEMKLDAVITQGVPPSAPTTDHSTEITALLAEATGLSNNAFPSTSINNAMPLSGQFIPNCNVFDGSSYGTGHTCIYGNDSQRISMFDVFM